jgi:putative flippase GtrA
MEGLEISAHWSNTLAYAITFVTSYVLHRWVTFKSDGKKCQEIPRFVLIYVMSYLANYLALSFFLYFLTPIISQAGASIVFVVTSYLGPKIFVFVGRAGRAVLYKA